MCFSFPFTARLSSCYLALLKRVSLPFPGSLWSPFRPFWSSFGHPFIGPSGLFLRPLWTSPNLPAEGSFYYLILHSSLVAQRISPKCGIYFFGNRWFFSLILKGKIFYKSRVWDTSLNFIGQESARITPLRCLWRREGIDFAFQTTCAGT